MSAERRQVSIKPRDIHPTCADADFTLVYRISASGKALGIKRHADCHRRDCKRCQTAGAKTARALERRGWQNRQVAQICATSELESTGCTVHLSYTRPDQTKLAACLKSLRCSREQQDGVALYTQDGRVEFLVTPQSAQRIQERLGKPVSTGGLTDATLGEILDHGYKASRGWGRHSGAKIFGKPRSVQSPPPTGVSIKEFSCQHIDTDERLRARGIKLPGDAPRRVPIDDGPIDMVPSKKEEHVTEDRLRQILREELQLALQPLLEQLRRGEISAEEFERRSRRVLDSGKVQ